MIKTGLRRWVFPVFKKKKKKCGSTMNSPDVVAQEQAVGILQLVGLLALNGAKPPGVINH